MFIAPACSKNAIEVSDNSVFVESDDDKSFNYVSDVNEKSDDDITPNYTTGGAVHTAGTSDGDYGSVNEEDTNEEDWLCQANKNRPRLRYRNQSKKNKKKKKVRADTEFGKSCLCNMKCFDKFSKNEIVALRNENRAHILRPQTRTSAQRAMGVSSGKVVIDKKKEGLYIFQRLLDVQTAYIRSCKKVPCEDGYDVDNEADDEEDTPYLEDADDDTDYSCSRLWKYTINGQEVCQYAWCVLNGWAPRRPQSWIRMIAQGAKNPYTHDVDDKKVEDHHPGKKGQKFGGSRTNSVVAWLKFQALRSDLMPTEDGLARLPHYYRSNAWAMYNHAMWIRNTSWLEVSYRWFCSVWANHKETKQIKRQRRKGTLGQCSKCKAYEQELCRVPPYNAVAREEVYLKYRGHLIVQHMERQGYYDRRELAAQLPHDFLSGIMDGADQSGFSVPKLVWHIKEEMGLKRAKQGLIGIYYHTKGAYFYPVEKHLMGGANQSCTFLLDSLVHLCKNDPKIIEHGLPGTFFLQMDNCGKDNKNRLILGLASFLVKISAFETVVLSFLIVGHTHEDIDQIFAVITRAMRGKAYLTFDEFDKVLLNSLKETKIARGTPVVVKRFGSIADYWGWAEPSMDTHFKGIAVPNSFCVTAELVDGIRTPVIKYRSLWTSEEWHPKPATADKFAPAIGITTFEEQECEATRMFGNVSMKEYEEFKQNVAAKHNAEVLKVVAETAKAMPVAEPSNVKESSVEEQIIHGTLHGKCSICGVFTMHKCMGCNARYVHNTCSVVREETKSGGTTVYCSTACSVSNSGCDDIIDDGCEQSDSDDEKAGLGAPKRQKVYKDLSSTVYIARSFLQQEPVASQKSFHECPGFSLFDRVLRPVSSIKMADLSNSTKHA
jgi:hypothetical protein